MQCACAILSSVAYPALQYSSTLSNKRNDFREKTLLNKKNVLFSIQLLCETFLMLKRNEQDMIKNI
jgi:hypothetical protein